MTILASCIGCLVHLETHLGGTITALLCLGLSLYLAVDADKANVMKRTSILLGFGFFKGMSLGGLVELTLHIKPAIILVALTGTLVIFACFSAAALVAKRRSYLYLGGLLSSVMCYMLLGSIVNMFIRSPFFFDVNLYLGLFVFIGYVVYDTQLMIEKAIHGSRDVAWDAFELFMDFVAIFVRIVIILLKNNEKKERKEKRRD